MDLTVLSVRFPRGELPVRGFRCATCGEEAVEATEAAKAQKFAAKLGLRGPRYSRRRRLLKVGNSTAVTLERAMIDEVLGGAAVGSEVTVGVEGDAIVIRRSPPAEG